MHEQYKLNCSLKNSCLHTIAKQLQKAIISPFKAVQTERNSYCLWTDSCENSRSRLLEKKKNYRYIPNLVKIGQTLQTGQSFIYSPTDAIVSCLKRTILKFTLKFTLQQLRHISVLQLHHHQGAH